MTSISRPATITVGRVCESHNINLSSRFANALDEDANQERQAKVAEQAKNNEEGSPRQFAGFHAGSRVKWHFLLQDDKLDQQSGLATASLVTNGTRLYVESGRAYS